VACGAYDSDVIDFFPVSEAARQLSEELSTYFPRIRVTILDRCVRIELGRDLLTSDYWGKIVLHIFAGSFYFVKHWIWSKGNSVEGFELKEGINNARNPLERPRVNGKYFELKGTQSAIAYMIGEVARYLAARELQGKGSRHRYYVKP
jgi:hypothetical protein